MLKARGLGVLAVPAAASLAGVLVIACSERALTAPDDPSLAKTKEAYYDDTKRIGSCGNDTLLRDGDIGYVGSFDGNGNSIICLKRTGPGPKK